MSESGQSTREPKGAALRLLSLGALGVVYGDIGTSPLYAMREAFRPGVGATLSDEHVLGIVSLFFWSLTLVISVKYLTFVMRADQDGEGGILALLGLAVPSKEQRGPSHLSRVLLIGAGLFGAALLYGDGIITPSISVLSAVEGLGVATRAFDPWVVPLTIVILIGLFMIQSRGTGTVGRLFGPVMLVWFTSLAVLGLVWVARKPAILAALSPVYAIQFLASDGTQGFMVLGAVVLCITGGEALYADMGHFGRRPIRLAWYAIVFPALILNYFGQGALLLERGSSAVENPFFEMAPHFMLYPLVALATVATIIASQALISGAFSLTRQAVQLGYLPRVDVRHTSSTMEGQIYIPEVNWALMAACVALVLTFQQSSRLAAAYGVAVTATMSITSVLFFVVMRRRWGAWKAGALVALFLVVDLAFFGANLPKIPHVYGGWFPLAVAALIYGVMTTWKKGRAELAKHVRREKVDIATFLKRVREEKPPRVKGTSVYMTIDPSVAPRSLMQNYRHNHVLHEHIVLLSIVTEPVPRVSDDHRLTISDDGEGVSQVIGHYGFMQIPDVPNVLGMARHHGVPMPHHGVSYFLGRATIVVTGKSGLSRWRGALFAFLSRNSMTPAAYYRLPIGRIVELGDQVEL